MKRTFETLLLTGLKRQKSDTNLEERGREFDARDMTSLLPLVPIESLPLEILAKIFSFLPESLLQVGQVSRAWNALAYREAFNRGMHKMETLHDNRGAIG